MPKYHGKFEKKSRPRLFLWIGVGCSVLALVCACFIVKFLYQAAIYRHDMRHHLNMIDGFLDAGKPEQALAYIRKTREDMMSISVRRFCENEAVNLICSSFADKAARMEVRLNVSARLPQYPRHRAAAWRPVYLLSAKRHLYPANCPATAFNVTQSTNNRHPWSSDRGCPVIWDLQTISSMTMPSGVRNQWAGLPSRALQPMARALARVRSRSSTQMPMCS